MSSKSIPSDFLKNVLQNGAGRYVCQLQRLTIKFCKSRGDNKFIRDFIENRLLDFVNRAPGTVVYLHPRRHHTPLLVAEYLNGRTEHINLHRYNEQEIAQWVEHLRTRSGREIVRTRKKQHTDWPSIQGIWTPMTNRAPEKSITEFPDHELSVVKPGMTATELLKLLAEKSNDN